MFIVCFFDLNVSTDYELSNYGLRIIEFVVIAIFLCFVLFSISICIIYVYNSFK